MKNQKSKIKNQIYKSKFKTFYFLIALLPFAFLLLPLPAFGQELSVSIDPPIFQIEAEAPADISSPLSVTNLSNQTVSYTIFLMPFKPSSSANGEIEFDRSLLPKYNDFFANVRIQDGDKAISAVTLAPDEKKDLTLRVIIPEGFPPKDYYFSVLFISTGDTDEQPASSTLAKGGIGSNVLLSVGPKAETTGTIKEFLGPKFVTRGPVDFILNVFNSSNHFTTIEGDVIVKNMFGHKIRNIELQPDNILSKSDRYIQSINNTNVEPRVVFDEAFLVGFYTAEVTVALSEEGPILKDTLTFFAFPFELILILAMFSIILIFIIQRVKSKRDNET